jgi:hypothetical protein
MSRIRAGVSGLLISVFFFGWITYGGWVNQWYSDIPEHYAYPASLSNQSDPHWGFWFW